jgi:hypothetical protein
VGGCGSVRRHVHRVLLAGGPMSTSVATTMREAEIRAILDDLIRQRRRIDASQADDGLRHANRLGIVYWQVQLRRVRDEGAHKHAASDLDNALATD